MIDPSKDKFAYFKDNIQTAEDKEEFDASQYYYNRDDLAGKALTGSLGTGVSGAGTGAGLLSLGLGGAGPSAIGGGAGNSGHLSFSSPFGVGVGVGDVGVGVGVGGGSALGNSLETESSSLHSLEQNSGGMFSGFNSTGIMGTSANSFAGAASTRPSNPEGHRMNAAPDHLSAVVKGRSFQSQADNKPPDMSEFPALGSRLGSMTLDGESVESRLRSAPSSEFVIQKEDFPALSAFAPGSVEKEKVTAASSTSNSNFFTGGGSASAPTPTPLPNAIGTRSATSNLAGAGSTSLGAGGGLGSSVGTGAANLSPQVNAVSGSAPGSIGAPTSSSSRTVRPSPTASSSSSVADLGENGKFGLVGLFHSMMLRSKTPSGNESGKRNFLSVGYDLTSLGLNLNSAETLHPSFASPWSETPVTKERQFTLPSCYYHQPPVLKTTHLTKFHLETLFYIFYAMPKDVLQAYAAQELYARDWRYHGELQLWLKRATSAEIALLTTKSATTSASGSTASGSNALSATSTSTGAGVAGDTLPSSGSSSSFASSGGGHGAIASGVSGGASTTTGSLASASSSGALGPQYVYFDTTTWERRVFTGGSISGALLSEEDIRVKLNNASS